LTQRFPNAGWAEMPQMAQPPEVCRIFEFVGALGHHWVAGLTVIAMTVRQMIDELISDSIDEIEGRPPAPRQPAAVLPAVQVGVEISDLAAQVRELTAQVEALVTVIRRLREE
jgi:hypothetical protein